MSFDGCRDCEFQFGHVSSQHVSCALTVLTVLVDFLFQAYVEYDN